MSLLRAADIIDGLQTEANLDVINAGIDESRAAHLEANLDRIIDQDALFARDRRIVAEAYARAARSLRAQFHEEPTQPNSTILEIVLGKGPDLT